MNGGRLATLLCSLLLWACQPLEAPEPLQGEEACSLEELPLPPAGPQLLIAHRGLTSAFPENSEAALLAAAGAGANAVEFDVVLSQDGIPVVLHDFDLARKTNCRGDARLLTWNQLQGCRNQGHPLPRLDRLLPRLGAYEKVFIELKTQGPDARRLAAAVGGIVSEAGAFHRVVVISYNLEALVELRRLHPWPRIQLGFDGTDGRVALGTLTAGFDYMLLPWQALDACAVAAAARLGVGLVTYTIKGPRGLKRLQAKPWAEHLTGIMFDRLDLEGVALPAAPLPPFNPAPSPALGAANLLETLTGIFLDQAPGQLPGDRVEALQALLWEGSLYLEEPGLLADQLATLLPWRISPEGLELQGLRLLEEGVLRVDTRGGLHWYLVLDNGQWRLDHFQS